MRAERATAASLALLVALALTSRDATACRTTTCPLPADFSPTPASCYPATFATACPSTNPPSKVLPLWWRNACVSYDVQRNASKWATLAQVSQIVAEAFAKWTATTCTTPGGQVGIHVTDLGPVDCDQVQYNTDQANQHVIIIHDDHWPYAVANATTDTSASTLGLTTVTFDSGTGEIFDADTEINGSVPLSVDSSMAADAFDLPSIITHEMGHFLGMAHSADPLATMYARYMLGSTSMRNPSADDAKTLCSIYPANGTRSVDPSVSPSGFVTEDACDLTPRHGWASQCAQPLKRACAVATTKAGAGEGAGAALAALATFGIARRPKRRSPGSRQA